MNKSEIILIVDDEEIIRRSLCRRLAAEGYHCLMAGLVKEAREILKNNSVDLVLLDINMPGEKGISYLPEIIANSPDTAIVMVTALEDTKTAIRCMREGAYDYVTKPFDLDELSINVARALERRQLKVENRAYQLHLEDMVTKRSAELNQALRELKISSLDTIQRLSVAAEYRDEDTGNHIRRMSHYCAAIARQLGLDDKSVENILCASPMHDIGKIGVPDRILLKTGPLAPEEWQIMVQHPLIGGRILAGSGTDFIQMAEVIALTHHEKWDGSGYPKGLTGAAIPLVGRIAAIADVFDALTSNRLYRAHDFTVSEARHIIEKGSGTHFDPQVTAAFQSCWDEILTLKNRYQDIGKEQILIKSQ